MPAIFQNGVFKIGILDSYQNPSKKDCLFHFDYHVFHSYRLLTASCLSLGLLCCTPGSPLQTQRCLHFWQTLHRLLQLCSAKCNPFVCLLCRPLVLVGLWFWWGWGLRWWRCPSWTPPCGRWTSVGYSATATRESRPEGLMCLQVKIL